MPNFTFSNLFQTHPSTEFEYVVLAFSVIIIFFLTSFIFHYFRKKIIENKNFKKASNNIPSYLRWSALLMLIITWTRLEGIPYISMRIWWIVIFLVMLYLFIRVWINYVILESKQKKLSNDIKKQEVRNKYLPKKKKRK